MSQAIVVHDPAALMERSAGWRSQGERIAFVPTMGNLHAGHFALIDEAKRRADRVIASVFVNPTQFGPGEDLDSYPRTFDADLRGLSAHGCELLYAPAVDVMYPGGTQGATVVQPPQSLTDCLCGNSRPGHFAGVATVVVTLLNQVRPDLALFGEKDFQQLQIIRRVVRDLALPVEIASLATVREASGLAMSSRNGYLNGEQRHRAGAIYLVLQRVTQGLASGKDGEALREQGLVDLEEAGLVPEYLEILDCETLTPARPGAEARIVMLAARLGSTRLIDNMRVDSPK